MEREFTVTSPDGKQYKVKARENATDEELIGLAQAQAPRAPANFEQKMLSSLPARIAKGIKEPIDAGAQLLPRGLSAMSSGFGLFPNKVSEYFDREAQAIDSDIKTSENQYQAARWATGQDGFDGGRLLGNVLSPANFAVAAKLPQAATTVGRIGAGMLGGAVGGALQPVTDISETSFAMQKAGQSLVGGATGAVVTPIVGKVADVLAPRIKALAARIMPSDKLNEAVNREADIAIRQVTQEMQMAGTELPPAVQQQLKAEVLASLKQGNKLDAAAALRKMDYEAQGVPFLNPQITRNPQDYSRAMNLRGVEGVGEPIANVLQAQNQKITTDIAKLGGNKALERVPAGRQFNQALEDMDATLSDTVGRAYRNARASSGKDWDIPLQGMSQDVQRVIDDFGIGGEKNAIPSAVANRLKALGILDGGDMTQRRIFNYEEADKLLKQINSHLSGDPANGGLRAIHRSVKQALMQDALPGDPFAPARKLAQTRFQLQEAVPALEAASKGEVAPDDFVRKFILGGKTDEVKRLITMLPPRLQDEARRQVAAYIQTGTFQSNATGDKLASAAGIQKVLKELGTEKLGVFFDAKQLEEVKRLARVTAYSNTEPAWGTVARGGNPGGVLFGSLARAGAVPRAIAQAVPVLGPVQQGLEARSLLSQTVPKTANLTPQEVSLLSKSMGLLSVGSGGLLAPGP